MKREPMLRYPAGSIDLRTCHFAPSAREHAGISAYVPSWYNSKKLVPHTNICSWLYTESIAALRALGARLIMQGRVLHF